MRRTGILITIALLCPAFAPAASREIQDLQREVFELERKLDQLQSTIDSKLGALQVLVQQTLESSNKSSSALADQGRSQQDLVERLSSPVATLNSRVESMGGDVSGLRESVNDLTGRMNKIQQQLTDLGNVIRAVQAPVAPPPSADGSAPPPSASTDGSAPAPGGNPPVKATTLYENALRDMQSGKADLALGEFQDYIKFYNSTDLAPNAQFYIGQIHYSQAQFDQAIQDFDAVLEQYPSNNKTADAHYMKGKTLFQLGQRTAAAKEFQAVVSDFPNSSVAPNARAQLKVLGINSAAPTARRKR